MPMRRNTAKHDKDFGKYWGLLMVVFSLIYVGLINYNFDVFSTKCIAVFQKQEMEAVILLISQGRVQLGASPLTC